MCGEDDCDKNKWHSRYECAALKTAGAANKLFNNQSLKNKMLETVKIQNSFKNMENYREILFLYMIEYLNTHEF